MGADGYIKKPIEKDVLLKKIQAVIGKSNSYKMED
jgi:DNA-binding response OmpR family regulator